MKTWKKIAIAVGVLIAVLAVVGFSVQQSRKGVVPVQKGKVSKQDIAATVTASGEVKPKTFANVGANAFGRIVKIYVKEGDHVKRGQLLAQLENVQPEADVAATRAGLEATKTDAVASEAALKTAQADLNRAKADEERSKL